MNSSLPLIVGPLKIGITGGIGSGKTTVCHIFEALKIPVYFADDRAKWLMVNDLQLVFSIKQIFGEAAYLADGTLDRALISSIVFSKTEKLEALNSVVHPAVFRDWERWQNEQKGVAYTLREAALLVETGTYKFLDKLIVVTAPFDLRIARVMERDGSAREAVEARISRQLPEAEKVKRADFIIKNDGSESLVRQVLEIHRAILAGFEKK